MSVVSQRLPASRTHRNRSYAFVPAIDAEAWGRLTITQDGESASYDVEEQIQEFPGYPRVFLLCHRIEGIYEVAITTDGTAFCSGQFCGKHRSCKHRDALLDLIRRGALPLPGEDYPYERDYREYDEEPEPMNDAGLDERIVITGNTYPVREQIKQVRSCEWDLTNKRWTCTKRWAAKAQRIVDEQGVYEPEPVPCDDPLILRALQGHMWLGEDTRERRYLTWKLYGELLLSLDRETLEKLARISIDGWYVGIGKIHAHREEIPIPEAVTC